MHVVGTVSQEHAISPFPSPAASNATRQESQLQSKAPATWMHNPCPCASLSTGKQMTLQPVVPYTPPNWTIKTAQTPPYFPHHPPLPGKREGARQYHLTS